MQADRIAGTATADPSVRRAERRRRILERSPTFAFFIVRLRAPTVLIARFGMTSLRKYVRGPYARAGYPGGLDDDEVVALGVIMSAASGLLVSFLTAAVLGPRYTWFGLCAVPAGFLAVVSILKSRGEIREAQIVKAMPYVLDLLVLILRSGTSLTLALRRVVSDYSDHPAGEELGQVLAEIEMGSSRVEALLRWAERIRSPDITALADSMVQSEELGWPLADTLERQADRMAAERVLRAQSKAGAAGVLVMIPSTLVLMAAVLMLFGPMLVRLLKGGFRLF